MDICGTRFLRFYWFRCHESAGRLVYSLARIYLSRVCSLGTAFRKSFRTFYGCLAQVLARLGAYTVSFPSVLSSRARSRTFTILQHLLENASSPVGRVFNDADHLVKAPSRWHDRCRGAVVPIAAITAASNRAKHVYCALWFDARAFIAWRISFRFPTAIIRVVFARGVAETTDGMTSSGPCWHSEIFTKLIRHLIGHNLFINSRLLCILQKNKK